MNISGKTMNVVYDFLRSLTLKELQSIYLEARDKSIVDNCQYAELLAYQCVETLRRYSSGQWSIST